MNVIHHHRAFFRVKLQQIAKMKLLGIKTNLISQGANQAFRIVFDLQ